MDLSNGGLLGCLGISLLWWAVLVPFLGWRMLVDTWLEKGGGGYVVVSSSLLDPPLWVLVALAICVLLVVPACGLPVFYLIVIGWLVLGFRVVLRLQTLLAGSLNRSIHLHCL